MAEGLFHSPPPINMASGNVAENFRKFKQRFEIFMMASGKDKQPEQVIDIETGKLLGPNCQGEICFRSPLVMKGYRGNLQATQDMYDKEGFLHSGDLGFYDTDGYFYVVDRIKELFKYRRLHVSPTDIEEVLLQHPAVQQVAVVGMPHEEDCAHATAFVVMRPGSDVTQQQLIQLVQDKLPSYKWLYGGVQFITELPKTASGKIQKYELKRMFGPEGTA